MKSLQSIKNLTELLSKFETQSAPTFINLCSYNNDEHCLMGKVVRGLQKNYRGRLGYEVLTGEAAKSIKMELKVYKSPILLLVNVGKLIAVFEGIVGIHKLKQALENLMMSQE